MSEKLTPSLGSKMIIMFIINFGLFIVYWYVLTFLFEFFAELVLVVAGQAPLLSDGAVGAIALFGILVNIGLAIFLRGKIYFSVRSKKI